MPTLTISGTISFPLGLEASPPEREFKAQLSYTERNVDDVVLAADATDEDLMGKIADAKACYIEVTSGQGELKVNGASQAIPIHSDGGFWIYFNPNGGLTTLTASETASAELHLRLYMFA